MYARINGGREGERNPLAIWLSKFSMADIKGPTSPRARSDCLIFIAAACTFDRKYCYLTADRWRHIDQHTYIYIKDLSSAVK